MNTRQSRPFYLFRRGRGDPFPCAPPHRRRPLLEPMEDRTLLSPFTVTNLNDTGPGSFREAIIKANAQVGDDTITIAPGLTSTGAINLKSSLVLEDTTPSRNTGTTTIIGAAAGDYSLKLKGGGSTSSFSILTVHSGYKAIIERVDFTEGRAAGGGGIRNDGDLTLRYAQVHHNQETSNGGGGIFNTGTLSLIGSGVSVNTSTGLAGGGGIRNIGTLTISGSSSLIAANTSVSNGGGIRNSGTLTIESGVVFENNTSTGRPGDDIGYGGAIFNGLGASLSLSGSTLSGNNAIRGGAIENEFGSMTLSGCNLTWNRTSGHGGAIFNYFASGDVQLENCTISLNTSFGGHGGGVYSHSDALSLINCSVTSNQAQGTAGYLGGGLFTEGGTLTITSSTIAGNLATGSGGGLHVSGGPAALSHVTVSQNLSYTDGGGIMNLATMTVSNSTITENQIDRFEGGTGGGIHNRGTLSLISTTVRGNVSELDGGGIANWDTLMLTDSTLLGNGSRRGDGGGLAVRGEGVATVVRSTISGNGSLRNGGGIHNAGILAVTNSTVAGNTSRGHGAGLSNPFDGVSYPDRGTVTLTNVTVSANAGNGTGGGIWNQAALTLNNTIVAGNTAATLLDLDGNYAGDGNLIGGDPRLEPLGDNGGPTWTMMPRADSPAINGGIDALVPTGVTTDQRGEDRFAGRVDVGSVEYQEAFSLVVTTALDVENPADGQTSLREAIANAASTRYAPGSSTITFALGSSATIQLDGRELAISDPDGVIIDTEAAWITVNAQRFSRVFRVDAGATVELRGLDITGGRAHPSLPGQITRGGGISNAGTVTLTDCTVGGNEAFEAGGGVENTSTGIMALNGTSVSGNSCLPLENAEGGGGIRNAGTMALTDCTIVGNRSDRSLGGGGLYNTGNVTLTRGSVGDNHCMGGTYPARGGGIDNENGTMTLTDCTIRGNTASEGGGIANRQVYMRPGSLVMTGCTVSDNTSTYSGAGGIQNGGTVERAGAGLAFLTNCTISGNKSIGPMADAGGLFVFGSSYAFARLTNCTVSGNSGGQAGGIAIDRNAGAGYLHLDNTIVAGNTGTDLTGLYSGSHNLVSTANAPIDPMLAPLGDYGGPTTTMKPLLGSPAIDAGDFRLLPDDVKTDQRGLSRYAGYGVDIGAVEREGAPRTWLVTSTADIENLWDNATSLREAIGYARSWNGPDVVAFAPGVDGTIALARELVLDDPGGVVIDAGTAGITLDAQQLSRVISIVTNTTADLHGLTLTGGRLDALTSSEFYGGGLQNAGTLTLTRCTVSGNRGAFGGGGIRNTGSLTLVESTVRDNVIPQNYGPGKTGGGILNSGTLTLLSSTVSGNACEAGAGGGIASWGMLSLVNSTVANNGTGHAIGSPGQAVGGGLYIGGTATLTNCTISANASEYSAGGIASSGVLVLNNTIVAGNTAWFSNPNIAGEYSGTAYLTAGDPMLAPLGDYGGPTQTMPPLPGSPAINAGDDALIPPDVITDQRGLARIAGPRVDIGAAEWTVNLNPDRAPPTLSSCEVDAIGTTIRGTVQGVPGDTLRIDFFAHDVADPTSAGEGQTYLGFTNVTINSAGNAAITLSLASKLVVGHAVSAMATDLAGNSSGFSSYVAVAAAPVTGDVSSMLGINRSGFSYRAATGQYSQVITITNLSQVALVGPLHLVLDNLSANATLANATGMMNGSPYITILTAGLSLGPGGSIKITLVFSNPTKRGITYATRCLAG